MTKKFRPDLASLIVGAALLSGGCANMGPADYMGAALTAGAGPIAGRFGRNAGLAAGAAGGLTSKSGDRNFDSNLARQYGNAYSGLEDPEYYRAVKNTWVEKRNIIFTCNKATTPVGYWPSGWTRAGNEEIFDATYLGVKRRFGFDEEITIAMTMNMSDLGGGVFGGQNNIDIQLYHKDKEEEEYKPAFRTDTSGLCGIITVPMNNRNRNFLGYWKADLLLVERKGEKKLSETYYEIFDNSTKKSAEQASDKTKIIELIKGYKDLKDKGILTEEQYKEKTDPLLKQL